MMVQSYEEFFSRFRSRLDIYAVNATIIIGCLSAVYNILQLSVCDMADDRLPLAKKIREDTYLNTFPCAEGVARGQMWVLQPSPQRSWMLQRIFWVWGYTMLGYFCSDFLPSIIMEGGILLGSLLMPNKWHKGLRTLWVATYRLGIIPWLSARHFNWSTHLGLLATPAVLKNFILFQVLWRSMLYGLPLNVTIPLCIMESLLCVQVALELPYSMPHENVVWIIAQALVMGLAIAIGFSAFEELLLRRLYTISVLARAANPPTLSLTHTPAQPLPAAVPARSPPALSLTQPLPQPLPTTDRTASSPTFLLTPTHSLHPSHSPQPSHSGSLAPLNPPTRTQPNALALEGAQLMGAPSAVPHTVRPMQEPARSTQTAVMLPMPMLYSAGFSLLESVGFTLLDVGIAFGLVLLAVCAFGWFSVVIIENSPLMLMVV